MNPNLVTVVSAPLGPFDVVCLSLLGSRLANSTVVCIFLELLRNGNLPSFQISDAFARVNCCDGS